MLYYAYRGTTTIRLLLYTKDLNQFCPYKKEGGKLSRANGRVPKFSYLFLVEETFTFWLRNVIAKD